MSNKETPAKKTLNIIALTQGSSIDVLLGVLGQLDDIGAALGKIGAVVSFARHFQSSDAVRNNTLEVEFLKEWETIENARGAVLDRSCLEAYERQLAPGAIWNAILADRRLIYGKRSKFIQDYRVHFTDEQLWAIAQSHIDAFEDMLKRVQPDVILSFTPVTFGEMLSLEIAQSRGIPILQLHSSRIQNYFGLHDVMTGTSSHFKKLMEKGRFKKETRELAKTVMTEAQEKGLLYEGVDNAIANGRRFTPFKALRALPGVLRAELKKASDPILRNDNHDPGFLMPWLLQNWYQPLQERWLKWRLKHTGRYIGARDLAVMAPYAFFPLHSEPEIALQVLGRPYHKNQIELIRNLAASLPAGMRLVVKEHPRSMGLRPYSYYKALMQIPNLYLADAHCPSKPVVASSEFVAVISGTIGFEAIMMQKPVLIFGHPKYEGMGGEMTIKCFDLYQLPEKIRTLLDVYKFDPKRVENFICAMIEGSVPIDLYSNLLKKQGRQSYQEGQVSEEGDLAKLARYALQRIKEVRS